MARAEAAAAEVDAFLQHRRPVPPVVAPEPDRTPSPDTRASGGGDWALSQVRGERSAGGTAAKGVPLRLAQPDWLRHELDVVGPDEAVAAFAAAASGSGTVPWVISFDRVEEDLFLRLVGNRQLSLAGARILAGQLREAAEHRHGLAAARVGYSRACPLDLHSLVPVAAALLTLGPDHPDSLLWLWEHWGTTEALRHATMTAGAEDRRGRGSAGPDLRFRFWSADWSPWWALERVRSDWPGLRFDLRPRYDPG